MHLDGFETWLSGHSILVIGLILFVSMGTAATVGFIVRARRDKHRAAHPVDSQEIEGEGYVISAVLGLLALLMGFTFSLAVDRYEIRRGLVLEEANAIGTAYLRAQILPEPHRARMSDILIRYTDNRLVLAKADVKAIPPLLATNDGLVTDMWAATTAAFEPIKGLDFSSAYVESVNAVIDLDASRKAARAARVPAEVFLVLFTYLMITALVLGYVLVGRRGQISAGFLLALLTLSLMLVIDIDRPGRGGVIENQGPMELLQKSLHAIPSSAYDRWRTPSPPLPPKP